MKLSSKGRSRGSCDALGGLLNTFLLSVLGFAACGGGGGGGGSTPNPTNPQPSVTSISPTSADTGGPPFTLTVNGSSFISSSVVRWNGSGKPTTFVSSTRLTAAIPAGDIAADGAAQVTVFNPTPGGGTSTSAAFTISAPSPVSVNTSQLPTTSGGKAYDSTIQATGGIPPYSWKISAGALPGGLSLDSASGRITGVAGAVASDTQFNFTVRAADSAATPVVGTRALAIMVRATGNLGQNDSCTGGVAGTTAISNGRIRASISPYGDVDVFSFQGTAGNQVTIEILVIIPLTYLGGVCSMSGCGIGSKLLGFSLIFLRCLSGCGQPSNIGSAMS